MKKKILSILCSIPLLFSSISVCAEEQILTKSGTANVQIIANVVSTFEVQIPDIVEITERGVKEFDITASGNISSSESLDITVPDTVTMTTEGKNPIDLTLTVDADAFTSAQLAADGGAVATCSVDASDITAGVWTGAAEITVQLIDNSVVENP